MKQILPFVKDISFNTKINEITSIALEHNLKMENDDSIVGTFDITGKYKINMISINEEEFDKRLNFDITLDDKYDSSKVNIDIDNFYYEIINEDFLRVHIDVLVDNLVYKKEERCVEEEDAIDINYIKEEEVYKKEENKKEIIKEEKEEIMEINEVLNELPIKDKEDGNINLASNFLNDEEHFITYKVHIIRENETIETIKEMYKVTKEELEKYNVLDDIMYGSKIIIPISNE